jgi:hypothetical protein
MRLRIGIGMARMSTLCHKSLLLTSYIIYGNALANAMTVKIRYFTLPSFNLILPAGT